jgi:hypothetical protein
LDPSPKSFLNPVNLKIFFDNYMEQNFQPILKIFNLATVTQIDSLIGYFHQVTGDQVEYQSYHGKYEQTAFSKLIIKTLNDSYASIQQKVPFELTSRYVAASIQLKG